MIERGLIREGGLLRKSNDMDTNDSFSLLLLHILQIQHTIASQIHKFGTDSIQHHVKITMQACLAKYMENLRQFLEFDISGESSIVRGLIQNFGSEGRGLLKGGINGEEAR